MSVLTDEDGLPRSPMQGLSFRPGKSPGRLRATVIETPLALAVDTLVLLLYLVIEIDEAS